MLHVILWSELGEWVETDNVKTLQKALAEKSHRVWVDISEPSTEELQWAGDLFQLHPLTLRAIQDRVDDPKMDIHEHYTFLVLHRIFYDFQTENCELREFEACFSDRFIVTTHTRHFE